MNRVQNQNIKHNRFIYDGELGDIYDSVITINSLRKKQHHKHLILFNDILNGNVKRVADLGCGTGEFTLLLYRIFPNARIYAVDVSSKMLNKFREKLSEEQINRTKFINMDMERFLHSKRQYDVIVLSSALHHMITWKNVLKLISQKTKCLYLALEPDKMDFGLIRKFLYYSIEIIDRNSFIDKLRKDCTNSGDPDIGGGINPDEIREVLKDFYIQTYDGIDMRHAIFYFLQVSLHLNRHFTLLAWKNKLSKSNKNF